MTKKWLLKYWLECQDAEGDLCAFCQTDNVTTQVAAAIDR